MESPYLTTKEAAEYLRFESPSAIRNLVMKGELMPAGAGPNGTHMFVREELDRWVRDRWERQRGAPPARAAVAPTPKQSLGATGPITSAARGRRRKSKDEWGLRAIVDRVRREREEAERPMRPSRRDPQD
jgi:hypothetical protein